MNTDPNEIEVIKDVVENADEQPIIPTLEDLSPPPIQSVPADPPIQGVDPEAPYGRNKDGSPARKRGRKTGSADGQFARLDSVTESSQSQAHRLPKGIKSGIVTDYRPIANLATGLWIGIPQIIFGEDWKAENEGQEKVIADAFHNYFKAKGITEISPEIALSLALGSYAIVRVNKPTVKNRIESGVAWLKAKIKR